MHYPCELSFQRKKEKTSFIVSDHKDNTELNFYPNHIKDGAVPLLSAHSWVSIPFGGKNAEILN